MPDLFQSGAGEHSTYRSTAGLRDQTNEQADECGECRGGKARPEHDQEVGQRARYGGAGKHRRITLTRVVQKPSMLSPSPSKITDLDIPGASPRPADRVAPAKLRNTSELALLLIALATVGILAPEDLHQWAFMFCGPACVLMLAVMLLRLDMYTGRTGEHTHRRASAATSQEERLRWPPPGLEPGHVDSSTRVQSSARRRPGNTHTRHATVLHADRPLYSSPRAVAPRVVGGRGNDQVTVTTAVCVNGNGVLRLIELGKRVRPCFLPCGSSFQRIYELLHYAVYCPCRHRTIHRICV